MARKPRDHKAEYQRRKQLAQQRGFKSVRQYKRVRKELTLPRTSSVSMKAIRREGVEWSASHSRKASSRYRMDFTDAEAVDYYQAYVLEKGDKNAKLKRLHKYLVGNGLVTEDEWVESYMASQ